MILEINTRLWLKKLSQDGVRTLADVSEDTLDEWYMHGFEAIWLMGVWSPSPASRMIARSHAGLTEEFRRCLPDVTTDDITASPFALLDYRVNPEIGGETALLNIRERLNERGQRLILDFVPNHMACDCPWIYAHPDWFIQGDETNLLNEPGNWFRTQTNDGEKIIAHGRDPYFPGWTDTAQLDITNPELQEYLTSVLVRLSGMCDGIRCDMAMLITNEAFQRTWEKRGDEFWPKAITAVREKHPDFMFIAEVYWNMDRDLRAMGFDLTYDKDMLDVILTSPDLSREMFDLPLDRHRAQVRFLENHDEPRIASRLDTVRRNAAAAWMFALPSAGLMYDGQIEGSKVRPPVQLLRAPEEDADLETMAFYDKLLRFLQHNAVRDGDWKLLDQRSSWHGNDSYRKILGQAYDYRDEHLRVFMNWADHRSQCWVDIQLGNLHEKEVVLSCELSGKIYVRDGTELMMRGLYLDMEPWETHMFNCTIRPASAHSADGEQAQLPDASIFANRF